jgi:beta-glucosidase/6-phospho-beta-glucosidase/beta-galactosidase
MVHLKQFAKGELNNATNKWRGEVIDPEVVPYNDLPWEVEATSLEYILYGMYKDYRQKILEES